MRNFLNEIENRILIHDGSKGYLLQKMGLKGGECGELWNLTNRDAVLDVYRSYIEAGSDVIQTNTFPGNRIHLQKYSLADKTYEINYWGAKLAREAAGEERYVCASIGPSGLLFEPSGELSFDKAYEVYCEQVKAVADGGADIINFETFTDLAEIRAALLAAKDTADLPVICSLAFENGGRTLMGTDPYIAVLVLKSLGADLVGANCSFGPEHMEGIVRDMYEAGGGYLSVKPNAGLPQVIDGSVSYVETAEHFAQATSQFVRYGARLIGGCCGSTPEFIKALKEKTVRLEPAPVKERPSGIITSTVRHTDSRTLNWKDIGLLDTSKDTALLAALQENDLSYVEDAALDLASEDYGAVYVNADAAAGDCELLTRVIDRVQWYVKAPLILQSNDSVALGSALRVYRGVAGVITGNTGGKEEAALLEVAARYGSVVIHHL